MTLKKRLAGFASIILTALLLVFAYRYIRTLAEGIDISKLSINWVLVVVSVLFFVGFYGLLSLHWLWACRFAENDSRDDQYLAFFASQPYKYLPTSLFTFSFRAVYANKLGLGLKKSSIAQFIENSSMFLSNFAIFAIFYTASKGLIYGLGAIILLLLIAAFGYKKERVSLKIRDKKIELQTLWYIRMLALAGSAWVLAGVSFVLLSFALGFDTDVLKLLAANTIAFSMGLLAFFAPGGIGVREFVYDLFSISSTTIIFWRILTFVMDFLLGGLAILTIKQNRS